MEQQQLIDLTADIVAAHVTNNTVAVGDVPNLISQVHEALSRLGAPPSEEPKSRTPVVSPRASIKRDRLVCLVCGAKQKTLKRHLATAHQMTPHEYRTEFGLSPEYPMVAADYSEHRRDMAKKIGLGRQTGRRGAAAEAAPKPTAGRGRKKSRDGA